jgi:hypothetical protein
MEQLDIESLVFDKLSNAWIMDNKHIKGNTNVRGALIVERCRHITYKNRQCLNSANILSEDSPRLCKIHINKGLKSNRKDGGEFIKNHLNGDAR